MTGEAPGQYNFPTGPRIGVHNSNCVIWSAVSD